MPSVDATAIIKGDKKAFRAFYRQYYPRLLAYVLQKVSKKEDAEELVQDSFLSFLDSLPLFQGKSSLWTFLVSIARHEVADYYRKKYAKKALQYVPFIDTGYTQDLYSTKETRAHFNQTLKKLVADEQKLLEWKYEQKLSVKEIAQKLNISVKATESRIFRARKSFQVIYTDITQN